MMNKRHLIFFLLLHPLALSASVVPLTDNILFAFEKCKKLSVDLDKGLLKETPMDSFDLHCRKIEKLEFNCDYFDTGSNKRKTQSRFSGGSDLGVALLNDEQGRRIKFLIGKSYASYESGKEQLVCAGIYLFEKDALKRTNK